MKPPLKLIGMPSLKSFLFILFANLIFLNILKAQDSETFYDKAFNKISSMLLGNAEFNFQQAVFHTENAYFEDMLDEHKFNDNIKLYSSICKGITTSGN
jgi:hypothetical protein